MNTAVSTRLQAEQLIQELDQITASGEFDKVALATHYGLIYSFQEHKLWNLQGVVARGKDDELGFIGVKRVGRKAIVTFWTREPDDVEGFLDLLGSGYARDVEMSGPSRDEDGTDHMFNFTKDDEDDSQD